MAGQNKDGDPSSDSKISNCMNLLFTTQPRLVTPMDKKAFENILGKGENAGSQHFHLFTQCFLIYLKQISIFQSHSFCCLQMFSI